jgi:F-type H+-transporting ATPase subunit epsilon
MIKTDMGMTLKILLPFRVFAEVKNVKRIVVETSEGSYGLLPQRLDCVAALVPGILTYESDDEYYVAVDEGIMIKAGSEVLVSVRQAIGGADLGKLHESVEKEFKQLDETEKNIRSVISKLETGLMLQLEKFGVK